MTVLSFNCRNKSSNPPPSAAEAGRIPVTGGRASCMHMSYNTTAVYKFQTLLLMFTVGRVPRHIPSNFSPCPLACRAYTLYSRVNDLQNLFLAALLSHSADKFLLFGLNFEAIEINYKGLSRLMEGKRDCCCGKSANLNMGFC